MMKEEIGRCGFAAAPSPSGPSPQSGLGAAHSVTNAQREASAHTPSEWKVDNLTVYALDEREYCNRFTCRVDRGFRRGGEALPSMDEMRANARLIAAAPDLLAALKQMLAEIGVGFTPAGQTNEQARRAIAKAEGR